MLCLIFFISQGRKFGAIIPRININTFFREFFFIKIDLDMSSIGSINISYLIKGY